MSFWHAMRINLPWSGVWDLVSHKYWLLLICSILWILLVTLGLLHSLVLYRCAWGQIFPVCARVEGGSRARHCPWSTPSSCGLGLPGSQVLAAPHSAALHLVNWTREYSELAAHSFLAASTNTGLGTEIPLVRIANIFISYRLAPLKNYPHFLCLFQT